MALTQNHMLVKDEVDILPLKCIFIIVIKNDTLWVYKLFYSFICSLPTEK